MSSKEVTKRAVLIGPVLPIRGGIAHHTTMLKRALEPLCDLVTVSYSRQYPTWLYPGGKQTEEHLSDYREPDVDYALDGGNPISWLTTARSIRALSPKQVILPWWTVYWTPMYLVLIAALRTKSTQIILIAHNIVDHESSFLKRQLTRIVLKRADRILVHNKAAADEVDELLGHSHPTLIHPHPIYDQFPAAQSQLPRRSELELLYFGFVRDYKGLDLLIEALANIKNQSWFLSIVGEFWHQGETGFQQQIIDLGLTNNIELVPRYVSDIEAAEYFSRADFVVLPYARSNGSGIVPLAYHYSTPVIVSDLGALTAVITEGKTGWSFEANNAQSLQQTLVKRSAAEAASMKPHIEQLKSRWSWSSMARTLLETDT